ncbi:MAG: hypothetical protein ACOYMF_05290 [Bacteroidales bacterium]
MRRFFQFIGEMYSGGTPTSSKRVFGSIGFIWYLILVTKWHQADQLTQILYVSCLLIGLETVKDFFVKKAGQSQVVPDNKVQDPQNTAPDGNTTL